MTPPIRLIIGLGNPGPEYEATRHNAGFWLADDMAHDLHTSFSPEKSFFGLVAKARFEGENVILAKPATYMNRSGQSAGALLRFYKLQPQNVLVLHDELDLLPGHVKLKQAGGHAGHNGLRDIQAAFGSPDFWRLRLGIGHPRSLGLAQQVAAFVLSPPRREEQQSIHDAMTRCRAILPALLRGDFRQAMAQLHEGNRSG
ncbi:MAG: aminoacyl-tRNA hydrolase [Burkholderiaceae bacterium]|jgi:PTH1 family peptidyl-tRNA hydrolase